MTAVTRRLVVSGAALAVASAALSVGNALSMPRLRRPGLRRRKMTGSWSAYRRATRRRDCRC